MLRDEEGRTRNSAGQLINAQGAVISDVIAVAEMNDFDLSREWYDWVGQDPFQGLPHQDPRKHIEELEDLVSRSEQNEVSEYHMLCKIFSYSFSWDAFSWFSQLQPGSLTSWNDIERAFLYKFLDDAEATREKEKNDRWDRCDLSVYRWQDLHLDRHHDLHVDRHHDLNVDRHHSLNVDRWVDTEDISSCDLIPNVYIKITMEDFLELEDEAQPQNLEHNLEKKLDDYQQTSEKDLETSKASIGRHQPDEIDRQPPHINDLHPPDIDRHRQPLIDRHHTLNIDRCPLLDVPPCCIIEMEPIEERTYMSKASHLAVPKHQRTPIWTEEAAEFHKRVKMIHDPVNIVVPCAVVEVESPIPPDRSMQLSPYIGVLDDPLHAEASQRGLLFRDEVDKSPSEAALIDTNQIPSIDATTSPSIDTGRVSEQKEFDVCGNLRDGDTTTRSDKSRGKKRRNWKKRKRIKDGPQVSLTPHFSDCVRKSRVRDKRKRSEEDEFARGSMMVAQHRSTEHH
ncbi:hypothetical protein DY000_02040985 [Brassica cretica]|uniref:Retrotransposon gag domain-containing protein n=1 Tax=Brassica cretica TaxID=69181 RepID=A0ABQ7BE05_BRACR|nr:hypothetical protein DY000_02040985 [Brassica cretica]